MKKYLISKDGNFYKANLHVHTTISDGKLTPEQTKQEYLSRGYSIVAFTDHNVMVPHLDLRDENFLPITSVEIDVKIKSKYYDKRTYHLNYYSPYEDSTVCPVFNKKFVWFKNSKPYITKEQLKIKVPRKYSVKSIQNIINVANANGGLMSYNHPVWSLQNYDDYGALKGLWGVEVYNTSCATETDEGYKDTTQPLVDLLRNGERVFPLATDDAHKVSSVGGGFVMVKAKALNYSDVFNSLKSGNFYASTAPEIHELYIENGAVVIKTSKAKKISLITERRYTRGATAEEGKYVNFAQFDINDYLLSPVPDGNPTPYIRIEVADENGDVAYTRAYFIDEIL